MKTAGGMRASIVDGMGRLGGVECTCEVVDLEIRGEGIAGLSEFSPINARDMSMPCGVLWRGRCGHELGVLGELVGDPTG